MKTQKKKVVLAFSGGLDTSFGVVYLIDQGFEVTTLTVNTGGFSKSEIKKIEEKSKKLGAKKHFTIDGSKDFYNDLISLVIKSDGLYEDSYPNMCADRYLIAKSCIQIAKQEGIDTIAHGSSAMGNDQVRFNVTLNTLAPEITILEPNKDIGGSRDFEKEYLIKKGFEVPKKHMKYSINQNLMGITYSGSEIDKDEEPDSDMYVLVNPKYSQNPHYFEIEFENGLPISVNNKQYSGPSIIKKLNKELGEVGFGKGFYTGDCMIGIKGHIVFEAPALLMLITAHKALAQYTLNKHQLKFGEEVSKEITDLIYTGKFYDPHTQDLLLYLNSQQSLVSGTVKMKIEGTNAFPVSVKSANSLKKNSIAMYAQSAKWSREEADGFIKLYGLQTSISYNNSIKTKGGE